MSAVDAAITWPAASGAEAVAAVARAAGLPIAGAAEPAAGEALDHAAKRVGLELARVASTWSKAPGLLAGGPLVAETADGRLLALLPARRGRARALTPEGRVVTLSAAAARDALRTPEVAAIAAGIEAELDALGVPARRRAAGRELLLDGRLGRRPAIEAWVVRAAPTASVGTQLREAGFFGALLAFVAAVVLSQGVALAGWLLLAAGALSGGVDPGWLVAWGLALATQVPLRAVALAAAGDVALRGGATVKRLLLLGALRGDLDAMRAQGIGGLMGRAIESEAFESLALNGGMRLVVGVVELAVALVIAAQGAGGGWLVGMGLAALAATALAGRVYLARHRRWTRARLDLTGDLVERMVGHRTRLAQERPSAWHRGEDAALARYLATSRAPDELEAALIVWPGRAFLALGLLAVALATGTAPTPLGVGLAVAGLLLGAHALDDAAAGATSLVGALVARGVVADLLAAARRPEALGAPLPAPAAAEDAGAAGVSAPRRPVLELARVGFAYPGRPRAVLDDVDLALYPGDRVLLEGASGSGKSTLAAMLAGLRRPSRGLALLRGLDPATWGDARWRRRAVAAPQFHDNRVIAGTFAFNLLLGRDGLATEEALAEAHALCVELGLGPLLERMPAGLLQQVGESGWQLSHGERSRLYLARALLQGADVVLLDESFGALDPENQRRSLACALARAPTLVVIAHP